MKKLYIMLMALYSMSMASYSLNITINDGSGVGNDWYSANRENNEVEPNTVAGQVWDMERFDLNGNILTMTGGFNFTNPAGYGGFRPGDLFFDVDGAGYYDYVAVVGFANSTYEVYYLGDDADVHNVYYAQNVLSNPWRYKDGGTLISSSEPVTYGSYTDGEGVHYTMDIDLSWLQPFLSAGSIVTLHNTMECGNDNLMGQFIVPVSDTSNILSIFGMGIGCLHWFRRDKKM